MRKKRKKKSRASKNVIKVRLSNNNCLFKGKNMLIRVAGTTRNSAWKNNPSPREERVCGLKLNRVSQSPPFSVRRARSKPQNHVRKGLASGGMNKPKQRSVTHEKSRQPWGEHPCQESEWGKPAATRQAERAVSHGLNSYQSQAGLREQQVERYFF